VGIVFRLSSGEADLVVYGVVIVISNGVTEEQGQTTV
jgi:hypothetical protein